MNKWSKTECELIVHDYMAMYELEMRGESYGKTDHRNKLLIKLNQRSRSSVEFKHRNISAVLLDSGYPYIRGYKPAGNYQALLKEVVGSYLSLNEKSIIEQAEEFMTVNSNKPVINDWSSVLTDAPVLQQNTGEVADRKYKPEKYNYAEREANNIKLGNLGEKFVLEYEQKRLIHAGREDLAKEVTWVSKEEGDGAGYDIRSFEPKVDSELFIEVKTTNSGIYQPFFISDNEVDFSDTYQEKYSLYRVFQFRDLPKLFILRGNISNNVNLQAKTYRASF